MQNLTPKPQLKLFQLQLSLTQVCLAENVKMHHL
ncbi:uncharacterized protein METZ01_LOCUS194239 [marine metagenome]|uniref:Uncharacterized protein n=1 Tax=marine metagenome TaxID=408172 RepID=A0A382DT10_9ZZZZ